jgi:hypothetical protein
MNLVVRISIPLLICIIILTAIFLPDSAETVIVSAITTFVSVCGAYFVIELIKEQKEVKKQVSYLNQASILTASIIEKTYFLRTNIVTPFQETHRTLVETYCQGGKVTRSDTPPLLYESDHTSLSIQSLKDVIDSKIDTDSLVIFYTLEKLEYYASAISLNLSRRNELSRELLEYTDDILIRRISGKHGDTRYIQLLESLNDDTSEILYLSNELLKDLYTENDKLQKNTWGKLRF